MMYAIVKIINNILRLGFNLQITHYDTLLNLRNNHINDFDTLLV